MIFGYLHFPHYDDEVDLGLSVSLSTMFKTLSLFWAAIRALFKHHTVSNLTVCPM